MIIGWDRYSRANSSWDLKKGKKLYTNWDVKTSHNRSMTFIYSVLFVSCRQRFQWKRRAKRSGLLIQRCGNCSIKILISTLSFEICSHHTTQCSWIIFQGLIVSSRKESLQHFKKPWAHEHEPVKDLIDAVKVGTLILYMFLLLFWFEDYCYNSCFLFVGHTHQAIKPTVLIGSSGVGRTFTKEVIEALASFNEVLLSFLLCPNSSLSTILHNFVCACFIDI